MGFKKPKNPLRIQKFDLQFHQCKDTFGIKKYQNIGDGTKAFVNRQINSLSLKQ